MALFVLAAAAVDPFDVSLSLLGRYLPQYAATGHDPIATTSRHPRSCAWSGHPGMPGAAARPPLQRIG